MAASPAAMSRGAAPVIPVSNGRPISKGALVGSSPASGFGPARSLGAWPEISPSMRQPSMDFPPTPSPVATAHLQNGWTGSAVPYMETAHAHGAHNMIWVQAPMMVAGPGFMPWQAPAAQMQFLAGATQEKTAAVSSASAQGSRATFETYSGSFTAQAPTAEQEGESTPVRKSSVQKQNQNMSAAGKQLFSEALDGGKIDTNIQEEPEKAVSGLKVGPMDSIGAELHCAGQCNPCAWFWKPRGCGTGSNCEFCHMCPEGELKRRKKVKIQAIKMGVIEPTHPRPQKSN